MRITNYTVINRYITTGFQDIYVTTVTLVKDAANVCPSSEGAFSATITLNFLFFAAAFINNSVDRVQLGEDAPEPMVRIVSPACICSGAWSQMGPTTESIYK